MKHPGRIYITLLLLIIITPCRAQLCQGSLGDPVVNITFGYGANPGPALPSRTNSYQYITGSCPDDGSYTITNNTKNCFGSTWHSITQDHTGDYGGYFMLVNASYGPGDFYVTTIDGLCPNTTFEFAAWVMNILKPSSCNYTGIKPNLTFSIETTSGAILKEFNSGDINAESSPQWKQFGFFFKTPANVHTVVVRIRNNAQGGCGNDLALDDITFRPCGPRVNTSINSTDGPNNMDICDYNDKKSYTLYANISHGFTNISYQWQESNDAISWTDIGGATTATFVRTPTKTAGDHYYRLTVAEADNINSMKCRIASNNIGFHVHAKPTITITTNSPACENTVLSLTATGGDFYQWHGPHNFSSTYAHDTIANAGSRAAGKYYVIASTNEGCSARDSVDVVINPSPTAHARQDIGLCEGDTIQLSARGGDVYLWRPAKGLSNVAIPDPLAWPSDSTTYNVIVTNSYGCKSEDTLNVNVYRNPMAKAGTNKAMMAGDKVMLDAKVSGTAITYSWTPPQYISDIHSLQPFVYPPHDTSYILNVISTVGCGKVRDKVQVKVFQKLVIPNAFSPNHDGINDTWVIEALQVYHDAELTVFNRYGQAVYAAKGRISPWNGNMNDKPLPVGTYYYVIDLKNGSPKLSGWVALLR